MDVPFLDLKAQNNSIMSELREALAPVIENAEFILGPATEGFEKDFAAYIGTKECVGLNNGTSALHMALQALELGPGDEIITTPHTWISTSWAISYVGATPVYVDIDPESYNLDPTRVEAAITDRTKAILPVHLYGQAADVVTLKAIAEKHGLLLIEDTAQAQGAILAGQRLGSIGDVGCFSFYPGKNLGAFGEAGAIVTNDAELAARIRRLRDHAQDGRHHHVELGFNTRMEGIQGAVLQVKLRHIDRWNEMRRQHALRYHENLAGIKGIKLPVCTQPEAHVWHLFVVQVESMEREAFRSHLADQGVATAVHYPTPVPYQPVYQSLGYQQGAFPVAEQVMSRCVSLPMFPELTNEQIDYTTQAIRKVLQAP